jgi:poly-gamma-glutamate synthase PgsB/CapB
MVVPISLLALVLLLLLFEAVVVRRQVDRLAVRVHVNGTRGKSSVTRYIAAGMRAAGKRTMAKVTGVKPTLIHVDGSATLLTRRGGARVQEQIRIIHRSAAETADCLVLECMSIRPDLQQFEGRAFRPHLYLMTNILDDHQEELGSAQSTQIDALCNAMAKDATVITSPGSHLKRLQEVAAKKGNPVLVTNALTTAQRQQIPEGVFETNIALALTACVVSGVDSSVAWPAILDEATRLRNSAETVSGSKFRFVNGFAVNDVPSAEKFIAHWQQFSTASSRLVVIFNARADRPLRSVSFAKYLPTLPNLFKVVVIGTHAPYMLRALAKSGYPKERIHHWSRTQVQNARAELEQMGVASGDLVMGLGNIGGDGHLVAASLEEGVFHVV